MIASINDINQDKPVFIRVAEDIADKIHSGIYTDRIPSVQALSKEHNVNFKTANRATAILVKEHILDCRNRRIGTLVAANGKELAARWKKREQSESLVLFFTPSDQHLYSDLYARTTSRLNRKSYFPIIISDDERGDILEKVMKLKPACLIVNRGWDQFPYDKLSEISKNGVRVIFQQSAECELSIAADYVLSDAVYGGYIATKHLIEQGHKRILHLTYQLNPSPPPMIYRHTDNYEMIQGYRMALAEAGLSNRELILYETADEQENIQKFNELLEGKKRATAIFAASDYRILKHYGTIKKLGLKVPDDLALVGYFDTPHCKFCEVPLTSVSINIDEIARHTVERINAEDGQHVRMAVKPELIIRKSSVTKM